MKVVVRNPVHWINPTVVIGTDNRPLTALKEAPVCSGSTVAPVTLRIRPLVELTAPAGRSGATTLHPAQVGAGTRAWATRRRQGSNEPLCLLIVVMMRLALLLRLSGARVRQPGLGLPSVLFGPAVDRSFILRARRSVPRSTTDRLGKVSPPRVSPGEVSARTPAQACGTYSSGLVTISKNGAHSAGC
jgi:hypothetical protein